MSGFPAGGMTVTNEDVGSPKLFGTVMDTRETFLGLAVDTTYPAGTLLGRVTASGKLSPAVVGAGDGTAIPVAVLPEDTLTANPVVDIPIQAVVGGQVNLDRLIFAPALVGVLTPAQKDLIRDFGIIPLNVTELGQLDNQ